MFFFGGGLDSAQIWAAIFDGPKFGPVKKNWAGGPKCYPQIKIFHHFFVNQCIPSSSIQWISIVDSMPQQKTLDSLWGKSSTTNNQNPDPAVPVIFALTHTSQRQRILIKSNSMSLYLLSCFQSKASFKTSARSRVNFVLKIIFSKCDDVLIPRGRPYGSTPTHLLHWISAPVFWAVVSVWQSCEFCF